MDTFTGDCDSPKKADYEIHQIWDEIRIRVVFG